MSRLAIKPPLRSGDRPMSVVPIAGEDYEFSPALLTINAPNDAAAEAIRALRTHVMAQHIQLGRRALAVCGTAAEAGCTFIAANLAVALSQIGVKTLLIDGDLRRPSLQRYITSPKSGPGLAPFLASDEVAFGDV